MTSVSSETFVLQGEVGGTPKVFVEFFVPPAQIPIVERYSGCGFTEKVLFCWNVPATTFCVLSPTTVALGPKPGQRGHSLPLSVKKNAARLSL